MPGHLKIGVETDGPCLVLALRDESNGQRATLAMTRRGAAPLAATVQAAIASEEDTSAEFTVAGSLETR